MLWDLVLELPLLLLTMGFASDFWQLVECAKYRNRVLRKAQLLNAFIRHLDPKWIVSQGENVHPEFGSCKNDILYWLDTRTNALLILANSLLLVELIISGLSYTLDPHFVVLNLVAFCSTCKIKPTVNLRNEILADVQMVLLYLYKWNSEDSRGCRMVVSEKIPRLKTALFAIRHLQ